MITGLAEAVAHLQANGAEFDDVEFHIVARTARGERAVRLSVRDGLAHRLPFTSIDIRQQTYIAGLVRVRFLRDMEWL
jgi:hypothetical protein